MTLSVLGTQDQLIEALDRGDLRRASQLAEGLRSESGRPVALDVAARFLPLIADQSPGEYDAWALRWLVRWLAEHGSATISQAAEIAGMLAELPSQPAAGPAIESLL